MPFLLVFIVVVLSSCTTLPYEDTTYNLDDFIVDSSVIKQGKQAIQQLEESQVSCYIKNCMQSYEEKLIDGDVLSVILYYPPRKDRMNTLQHFNHSSNFQVTDSKLHLPEIPLIDVGGLTLSEAKVIVESHYREQFPDAQVFMNFKKRKKRYAQIIGTRVPFVEVDGTTRLSEVLAKAKISPSANLYKSAVIRGDCRLPLDLNKLIAEGDDSQNIVVRGGDKIYIARAQDSFVMVLGEIKHPIVYPIPHGNISLREVIAHASDIPSTGSDCGIYVIRGNLKHPKIYHLSWQEMKRVSNQSLLLMEGDVVYIAERKITDWNRFISQLLPTVVCLQAGYNGYTIFR